MASLPGYDVKPVAIEAAGVRFAYDGPDVLSGVDVRLAESRLTCLLGHTGSGKSTLLRLLAGLEPPTAGVVRIGGVGTAKARDRRRLFGTVGYVMQRPERQLFCDTVAEDVAYGPSNLGLGKAETRERVERVLEYLGISELSGRSPFALSGGQQRLVALAGVLAMAPGAILLDEPLAGLDPAGRENVRAIIRRLAAEGVTVGMVTHEMDDAAAMADHVYVLANGRVLAEGAPWEVFSRERMLHDAGLGVPECLAFAHRLEAACGISLGEPMDENQLVEAILAAMPHVR